jgi:molybdate transport system substrate-binding protein
MPLYPTPCRRFVLAVLIIAVTAVFGISGAALAGEVRVAVAANFTAAAKDIGVLFARATGHKIVLSFGATGQLYTQITQGAPFDVFLAADRARPQRTVAEGFAVPNSSFTYATGRIVLYSRDKAMVRREATLRAGKFTRLAIANPATAPYGSAAVEALKALGVYDALRGKIVQGNNIAQAFQFVDSGNAEVGFVALSQLSDHHTGSRWIVPTALHTVIAQDAVLLKRGARNDAALAFLQFLKGPLARAIKEKFGYGVGN